MARILGSGHPSLPVLHLVISELVTNSLIHADIGRGRGWVDVQLEEGPGFLRVSVTDPGSLYSAPHRIPQPRPHENALAERGRGLSLVHTLCAGKWGTHLLPGSGYRTVWCHVTACPTDEDIQMLYSAIG